MRALIAFLAVSALVLSAQQSPAPAASATTETNAAAPGASRPATEAGAAAPATRPNSVTVPAGTRVPLSLKNAISTKNARRGDRVYAQTNFPVTANDKLVIPAGTYVQGVIARVQRAGRVKGRAEVLFHFTTLVFPNGYTVMLPSAIESLPGAENASMKDKEGTIQGEGQGGSTAATVGTTAATGTVVGGVSHGAKGALIGGGIGAAAGTAVSVLTRGNDVRLEPGTTLEMVLARPLTLDESRVRAQP